MTSGKQRKALLKQRRRDKARRTDRKARGPGLPDPPSGAVMADLSQLEHDNIYGPRPLFYVDRQFACIECGSEEVWTAADQKWWYEVAKGKLDSRAVRCSACRKLHQAKVKAARKVHLDGLIAKYGIEEAARRLERTVEEVQRILEIGHKVRRATHASRVRMRKHS
jgi:hypothetical protein